ncbi:MAG: hypothetical protein JO364_13165 [Pseudonocardiales bacterium]|nr:hypothetical protein [Pseudonocardiales bacterium]MBV9031222.1 hypothetical protein [Pseudonocardiales bacterium]
MSDQPRTRYPVQVSVPGTRTDDDTECTLLAIRETTGTWMIHSLDRGAVRLTEEQAARMATAILHLVSPVARASARAASTRGE